MRKQILYAILLAVLVAGGIISLSQPDLKIKIAEKMPAEKAEPARISALCANFTDASGCDSAVSEWEGKIKGGKTYAVVEYQQDGKSAFKEGWIIYMRLPESLPVPGTNRTTMRIGILADKNSSESQIYEFVE